MTTWLRFVSGCPELPMDAVRAGRVADERQILLYLLASEYEQVISELREALARYSRCAAEVADDLFGRDVIRMESVRARPIT